MNIPCVYLQMTQKEKAIAFSNGDFEKIHPFLAADAVWTVVEENTFTGKEAIEANCKQVSLYFRSVTTRFETHHVIEEKNKVVVSGTAAFLRNNKQMAFVSACDVYLFNEKGELQQITSYCIPRKSAA